MSKVEGVEGLKEAWRPFAREDDWSLPERLKTALLGLALFPFRLVMTIGLVSWYALTAQIGALGHTDLSAPLSPWRRRLFVDVGQPFARLLLFCLGFTTIKQSGSSSLNGLDGKAQANVMVLNHTSWLDILVMMAIAENIPGFVAKKETLQVPLIGNISKIWHCLYVDNRVGNSQNNITAQISARALRDDMPPILIFPEGTTTNGKYLITFRSGAFVGGHPVKPVCVRYPAEHFSPTWETIGGLWHVFRLLTQWRNYCEVIWLPVYYPSDAEKADPKLYAANVRQAMADKLKVLAVESSFGDKVDYHVAIGRKKASAPKLNTSPGEGKTD